MKNKKRNSIAKNVVHLFYSTALSSGLNAAALIVLASYLQSHNYGIFSVALAFAMIMGYFTDAGLSEIVLREGTKRETEVSSLMSSYIKLRAALMGMTFIIGFIFIHSFYASNPELIKTAYCLIIPMVTGIAMQSIGTTYFQLTERMQFYGAIRIISSFMLILTVFIGMMVSLTPYQICFLYGLSYFTAGLIGVVLVSRNVQISLNKPFHKEILNGIGSFTIGGLLFVIFPHLGTLVLEKTVSLAEVGMFAIAYRIPQALQQLPYIIAGAFCPVLFRSFNSGDYAKHRELSTTQIKITVLLGAAIAIPFYHMSSDIVTMLFGEKWIMAATPLKILTLMLILQSVSISLADSLTTQGMQNRRTLVQLISLLTGGVLYFYFSLSNGVIGAAYAGLAIEFLILMGFWLMIPGRLHFAVKAIGPYLAVIAVCMFIPSALLGSFPVVSALLSYIILSAILLVDKDIYNAIKILVVGKILKGSSTSKEADHGV
ncbi:oligosaccharide flippase family protein [Metabacillus indicus]|uniref:oligosaccharide flippase family protein n=1 Tax=Metabacillus indicus TaxID=246786 RepID=UPI00249389E9|nr:oligosaccharide flippase family protein [Metabacillus indicus]